MNEINRMENPICPASIGEAVLADVEVLECPFPTYDVLRNEAPVWQDPDTGIFVVSRYDDLRNVLRDKATFSNRRTSDDRENLTGAARKAYELFKAKGWVPAPSLAGRDDPEHKQIRSVFDGAFRASKIKAMDPEVEALAYQLVDEFINDGRCDIVHQYAIPLPLKIICKQMGAREEDVWQIKEWTDAWIKGVGFGLTEEELLWCTNMEIEAQHYFQPIFEELRKQPNDSLLSDLVNTVIPGWGRTLNDDELHCHMMQDTFVGGSETTSSAISAGIMLLTLQPDVWDKLKSDPDRYLKTFCEEVIRLEGPVQGLTRMATKDTEIHGVKIPQGSVLMVRFGAANRDPEQFEDPHTIDLERRNAASHMSFSSGTHHCLGAPLARREVYWAMKAFVDRIERFRLIPDENTLRHLPNYSLRALKELNIEFERARQ